MKKLIFVILAVCGLLSCSKTFKSSVDLGVNNTRINIPWANAQETFEFTFPVYSNGSWEADIVAGGDWLRIEENSGNGNGCIYCTSQPNVAGVPRAVRMEISGSGKTIPVYFVISSADISAAELEDADLDNYLI